MAKISGVDVSLISKIAGKAVASISKVAGKTRSSIATNWIDNGGGGGGPTCERLVLGYSDGRRSAPGNACTAEFIPYEYDSSTGILYTAGECGNESALASPGFYSDGQIIYDYTNGTLIENGPCGR